MPDPARRTLSSRRGVLLGGVAGAILGLGACSDDHGSSASRNSGPPLRSERVSYGPSADQHAIVTHPEHTSLATIVLLHGGAYLEDLRADQMYPLAVALGHRGYLTINVEYRRLGGSGGFPATFEDVATAIDTISGTPYDDKVVVLGHSAGGQLAAWAASRTARTPGGAPRTRLLGAVSLAGALDLSYDATLPGAGKDIAALMGGTPQQVPERYAVVDPMLLVPTVPVWAVEAENDTIVPAGQAENYVRRVRSRGATASYVPLPGSHTSLINPAAPSGPGIAHILEQAVS